MFDIIAWIVVGGLAGWLASMVMGTNREQGCLIDIVVGVVGAFLGGWLLSFFGVGDGPMGPEFDIGSLVTAFIGAAVLLFLWRQIAART